MGHSAVYQDSEWLACRMLASINELPPRYEEFCLVGIRAELAVRLWPEDRSRYLAVTFRRDGREWFLIVRRGVAGCLLQHPQTWRRAARKELAVARDRMQSAGKAVAFLARNAALFIDGTTRPEELALQLLIVFSQWGLGDITEADRQALVRYCWGLFRNRSGFRHAAEDAAGCLLTNWVEPEFPGAFQAYARRTMRALRVKEIVHATEVSEGRKYENQQPGTDFLSITKLAWLSGVDPRRVYEAIRRGKLPAAHNMRSLMVDRHHAHEFIAQAHVDAQLRELIDNLEDSGISREALRKRIHRLRKSGTSDAALLIRALRRARWRRQKTVEDDETRRERT